MYSLKIELLALLWLAFFGRQLQAAENTFDDPEYEADYKSNLDTFPAFSSGHQLGARSMRNPSLAMLFRRQEMTCDYPVLCGGGTWCCPAGYECTSSFGECCPDGQQYCGGITCAPEGYFCCDGFACPKGSKCSSSFGMCKSAVTATATATATATETTPATQTKTETKTKAKTKTKTRTVPCVTPTLTTGQTTTQTISFVYDPNRKAAAPTGGPYAGQKINAPPKAVMMNMCDGIKELNPTGGELMELTHGGTCFQRENRKDMCEKKGRRCKDALNDYIKEFFPKSEYPKGPPPFAKEAITVAGDLQCDEFPFASSIEGGDIDFGVTKCVPATEQQFQGGSMSSFFDSRNKKYITPGEKYHIQLVGWDCSTQSPSKRSLEDSLEARDAVFLKSRDAFTNATGVNIPGLEMYHGFDPENPKLKLMSMPLGDLTAGSYNIRLDIKGNINVSLTDFNGSPYNFTQDSDGTISFSLDDDYAGVGLFGTTTDTDNEVNVVYHASKVGSGSSIPTASTSTQPTATASQTTKPNTGAHTAVVSPAVALLCFSFFIANLN